MRTRGTLLVVVMLLVVAATGTSQEDSPPSPFHAEMSLQLIFASLDINGAGGPDPHLVANPSFVWRTGILGVGGGVTLSTPIRYPALYVTPYARAELWSLTYSAGWVFQLLDVDVPGGAEPVSLGPMLGLGVAPDPWPILLGRLGFDIGLSFFIPIGSDPGPSSISWIPDEFFPPGTFRTIIERILFSPSLGIGLLYTFSF